MRVSGYAKNTHNHIDKKGKIEVDLNKLALRGSYDKLLRSGKFELCAVSAKSAWDDGILGRRPYGVPVKHHFDPLDEGEDVQGIITGLRVLDNLTFGPREKAMGMANWVSALLMRIGGVAALCMRGGDLDPRVLQAFDQAYNVIRVPYDEHIRPYGYSARERPLVPVAMWQFVPTFEPHVVDGHNLATCNYAIHRAYPGLGTLVKLLGLGMLPDEVTLQCGTTQWDSESLAVHLRYLGKLEILQPTVSAHTHQDKTFRYGLPIHDRVNLAQCVLKGGREPREIDQDLLSRLCQTRSVSFMEGDRCVFDAKNTELMANLREAVIDRGESWCLTEVKMRSGDWPQVLHFERDV